MADEPVTTAAAEEVDELLLDLSLKKKKKKKGKGEGDDDGLAVGDSAADADTNADNEGAQGTDAAEDDSANLFADLKKKKKKKKIPGADVAEGAGADETAEAKDTAAASEKQLLGELKKKRKPKVDYASFVDQLGDLQLEDQVEEGADDLDLSKMKKKKKKQAGAADSPASATKATEGDDAEGQEAKGGDGEDEEEEEDDMDEDNEDDGGITYEEEKTLNETWLGSDRDYLYRELLDRAFYFIQKNNPDMAGERRKYTMIPPQVLREGTKKTVFHNLSDICKRMRRQPEHVIQFLFAELGTSGSVDGNQRLVIKGRFQQKQIENVLRSYILEYVTCKVCRRPDTVLTKENRLMFVQCQQCRANYSVSSIKTGFTAQVGRRKR